MSSLLCVIPHFLHECCFQISDCLVHFKILPDNDWFWPLFKDKDQTMLGWWLTCMETNSLKIWFLHTRRKGMGLCVERKKGSSWTENEKTSRFHHSCYCSLFWLSEDLTEPWPLCQQHEEVVRQSHNKTWCSWVLRNWSCRERSAGSPLVCLRFWHNTSGHHRSSCVSQALSDWLSTIRPHVCVST